MAFNRLEDFFRTLSPSGVSGDARGDKITDKKSLRSTLMHMLLNPGGRFYSYEDIVTEINNYLNGNSPEIPAEKEKEGLLFHALGSKRLDLSDSDYWDGLESVDGLLAGITDSKKVKTSVFSIKSPYVSPSLKGTEEIDFFLNYMPSIVTSQMVPYLDVEFHIRRPVDGTGYTSTPSVMRFLLGSKPTADMSPADKLLAEGNTYSVGKDSDARKVSVAGMELFLMPQTLTNMDSLTAQGLGQEGARLVRAKPFLPFASIEGLDVSMQNAGAGSFVHKKGSLKLKIHDKARISEMSEFFRGEVGFSQALIWTTYGWIAPRGPSESEDGYSSFINKNMLVKDCWQVMNSQFSFDQSGQVSVNLEIVSAAARTTHGLTVCKVDEQLKNFHRTIQWMNELKKKAAGDDGKFVVSATAEQVLNAASTNGVFKDIKDMDIAIASLAASLTQSGKVTSEEADTFIEKINSLRGDNSYDKFKERAAAFVKNQFDGLVRTPERPDPFLPVDKKSKYFPGKTAEAIKEIETYITNNTKRNEEVSGTQSSTVEKHKKEQQSKTNQQNAKIINEVFAAFGGKITDAAVKQQFQAAKDAAAKKSDINLFKREINRIGTGTGVGAASTGFFGAAVVGRVAGFATNTADIKVLNDALKQIGISLAAQRKKAAAEGASAGENVTGEIRLNADVVSFGKLFTRFVLPSIIETQKADELQVFFYGLNDKCGPMSSLSIAEFPIDVKELAYAYNDAVKKSNVDTLSLETFLRLVIETQFVNKGSLAYGLNRYYKITEENGTRKSSIDLDDKDTRDAYEKWLEKYGTLVLPTIEMFVETGEKGSYGKDIVGSLKKTATRTQLGATDPKVGGDRETIMRIHIYDRTNNPFGLMQKIINSGTGLEVGDIDSDALSNFIEELSKTGQLDKITSQSDTFKSSASNYKDALKSSGVSDETVGKFELVKRPGGDKITIPKDRKTFREILMKTVPAVVIGANGSIVLSVNVASKTDGLMGAINLTNLAKGREPGKVGLNNNGLLEANGLPLTVVPVQVTMTTLGVPTAQVYQTFFIDFDTGTTLDNLYSCSQIQHSISQGKFTTNWTFIFTDGYAKFGSPPSINEIIARKAQDKAKQLKEAAAAAEAAKARPKKPGKSSGRSQTPAKGGNTSGGKKPGR